jgi:hypothetical protein
MFGTSRSPWHNGPGKGINHLAVILFVCAPCRPFEQRSLRSGTWHWTDEYEYATHALTFIARTCCGALDTHSQGNCTPLCSECTCSQKRSSCIDLLLTFRSVVQQTLAEPVCQTYPPLRLIEKVSQQRFRSQWFRLRVSFLLLNKWNKY